MNKQFWIGIAVAIVCGVLSNLGTPLVTRWAQRLGILMRLRSLQRFEKDLSDVRHLHADLQDRQLYFFKQIFLLVSAVVLALLFESLGFGSIFAPAPLAWAAGRSYWTVQLVKALRRFERYEREALQAIEELKQKLPEASAPNQ